jgi:hypothetical protein
MTKLGEMIDIIKLENPDGLRVGSDEAGYTNLTPAEYTAQVAEWAQNRLDKQAKIAAQEAEAEKAKIDKAALLVKLDITADQAKLLLL